MLISNNSTICRGRRPRRPDIKKYNPMKNNIIFRKLKTEEINKLTELFNYKNIDEMIEENIINISDGFRDIFVLFYKNRLIGELHASYENDNSLFAIKGKRAYLFAYRIHKDFQGQGFGKFLLESTLNELQKQGYSEFTVGVEDDNIRARYIYKKYGFNTVISRQKESYQGDSYEYDLLLKQ